ncbi:hypothetical protein DEU56DRAFT_900094 [Suillus clintonianus]|uniref:uncharacterized protein n=1 Tax=Suillus clintonianus TaxID=1904413 RepID=UPI001B869FFE|nr:uncharacterized protein DEU56DRAFT_900094 [Suillus clintonianus]KAG2144197.1 hypothetical protein DEU56DRAFT_900094 [Suillus clintonianus]
MLVPIAEQLANLSLVDTECTQRTTLNDRGLGGQAGQGCQHPAKGIRAPLARSCSREWVGHQNDHAPLFRLPDEILAEILMHGVQMEILDGSGGDFEKTVSHVSMRWRTVAISNPCLWTHISVCPEGTQASLQTRILRSANAPVDVDIYPWPTQLTRTAPHSLLVQLNIILRCASRWRSLTVRSGPMESMFSFIMLYFTRYGTSLPSLEYARLYGSKMQVRPWSRALFFDERCTPRLSTLEVANMKICASSLDSQNSTITALILTRNIPSEIETTPLSDFIRIPSSFPSLTSLVIYGLVVDISSYQSSTDDHQYPELRTLGLHHINSMDFSPLITTLALMFPGVTHLNLTGPWAALSLLEAVQKVSADKIWPDLQKLVLNSFIGHEWSQIHRYLEEYNGGDGEDMTQ